VRVSDEEISASRSAKTAIARHYGPARTHIGWVREAWTRFLSNTAFGSAVGNFLSKTISLPQLQRLASGAIPWTPLRKSLSDSTVALISTGGVHLQSDRPFNINSDSTFRVIPKDTPLDQLAITHQAYDRTDALKDINLVFPIERLRELEEEKVIGALAQNHYGFGLEQNANRLMPSIKEVARRIRESDVDLALLVPA